MYNLAMCLSGNLATSLGLGNITEDSTTVFSRYCRSEQVDQSSESASRVLSELLQERASWSGFSQILRFLANCRYRVRYEMLSGGKNKITMIVNIHRVNVKSAMKSY